MKSFFVRDTHLKAEIRDAFLTLVSLAGFTLIAALLLQSWALALIIAASLSAHELGHIVLITLQGMDWKLRFSLVGAWTETPQEQRQALNHFDNSLIHLIGPVFSLLYACLALLVYQAWRPQRPDLLQLANFSAQVALFNLLPLGKASDGGKILRRIFLSLNDRGDWMIIWLPITWGVAMLVGIIITFVLQNGMETIPPQITSYLLVTLWLLIGMLIEKRHDDHAAWKTPQAMTYRQAWLLVILLGVLLLFSTLLVMGTPFWLDSAHLTEIGKGIRYMFSPAFW